MAVRQLSETQIARWVRDVENQGVRVTRTKKGLLLRLPDGSTAMKHFTDSDTRGAKNLAAELRRAGVISPDDKKTATLPKYITTGTVTNKNRQAVIDYVRKHDFPTVVFSKDLVAELDADPGTVNRMLYHCGFTVGDSIGRKGRPWYTPQSILTLKTTEAEAVVPPELKRVIDGARAAQEEINQIIAGVEPVTEERDATPEEEAQVLESLASPDSDFVEVDRPEASQEEIVAERKKKWIEALEFDPGAENTVEPEPQVPEVVHVTQEQAEDIQFIDMRDSWVVDLEEILDKHLYRMVTDRLAVLRAVGIDYEIRVWRKQ
jgi:hypothetical protein